MGKRFLWLPIMASMGILLGMLQLPPMPTINIMVDRDSPGTGQPQEQRKELVVAAAMKGAVEKRTPEYTVAPARKPDQSTDSKVGGSDSPDKEKQEKKEDEKKETPESSSPAARPR